MVEVVEGMVGGGQARGSMRHCMPPMTLASGLSMENGDEWSLSSRESNFRLLGRGVSGHKAQSAREEGVGSAIESL